MERTVCFGDQTQNSICLVSLWFAWLCVGEEVVAPRSSSLQGGAWLATGAYVWGSAWLEGTSPV